MPPQARRHTNLPRHHRLPRRATYTQNQCDFLTFSESALFSHQIYQVLLPKKCPSYAVKPCLFAEITPPLVITCVDRGSCWLCASKRFLYDHESCPLTDLDLNLSGVDITRLACPLCMGLDIALAQLGYLEDHAFTWPTAEEALEWECNLVSRIVEVADPVASPQKAFEVKKETWRLVLRGTLGDFGDGDVAYLVR